MVCQEKQGGEVLGTKSAKPTVSPSTPTLLVQNPVLGAVTWVFGHKKISLIVLLVIFAVLSYFLYRKKRKK